MDVETNPGPRRPVPDVCRILSSNMHGLGRNHSELAVASSQYDIMLYSETLVSDMRHVRYWFSDSVALSCCACPRCLGHEGWLHTYEMVTEHFANQNLSAVVVKYCFLGFVV